MVLSRIFYGITVPLAALLLAGCDLINPEEQTPAYLYLQPFQVTTTPATQGHNSSKITEGWLFVNGEYLGAYALPSVVPVLVEGDADIRLEAGIRDNGVSVLPDIYPFYAPFRINLNLKPGQTDTIRPVVSYLNETRFPLIEDFETDGGSVFNLLLFGSGGLQRSSQQPFSGGFSGLITLTQDNPVVEIATTRTFSDLLSRGIYVYLEVNYRSEAPVLFGVISKQGSGNEYDRFYDPGFLPSSEWNKIYLNLSRAVFDSNRDEYQLAFQALLPAEADSARIWLDNIKLIHF